MDRYREALWGSDLPPRDRFVALALSLFMDHDTLANAYPGNQKLAARTGYSVRAVQMALRSLETKGWIKEFKRGRGTWASLYGGAIPARGEVQDMHEGGSSRAPHPSTTTGRPAEAARPDLRDAPECPKCERRNGMYVGRGGYWRCGFCD